MKHRLLVQVALTVCTFCALGILLFDSPASHSKSVVHTGAPQMPPFFGLQFYPLPQPVRALETRAGFTGCTLPGAAINANATFTLGVRTGCTGIPANAAAVTGSVTVVPAAGGYLTLFPSDAAQPTVANSNFTAGEITNNVFTVGLGAMDGAFKIFASATTHVIVDVTGYYAPPGTGGLYFHPLPAPVRLLETRQGLNGCFTPGAPLVGTGNPNADPALDLSLQGRAPLPTACNSIPADAQVLVGNATSVFPTSGGYLTIYPSGGTRPLIASSNYAGTDIINGPFAVKLGADGQFKVYTLSTTHLVIDITGYYSASANDANGAGLLFNALPAPVRLLETRPDFPGFPLTGCTRPNAPIQGDTAMARHTQLARNFCGLPNTVQAVVGNVSVVNTAGAGYLTLFPGNLTSAPLVATSNYTAPASFGYNRHFFVGLGSADGTFKVLTQFTTDAVIDVSGYFAPLPPNQPPQVNAGADQTILLPALANLSGTVTDDGLPLGGTLTQTWSKVSGPGAVTFGNANQAATTAAFSVVGNYVLRLTANDGELSNTDEVNITVNGSPLGVNAGADQVITLPNTVQVMGAVTGGMGTVSVAWSQVSGPGTALFSNASALVTQAIFAVSGVYVLRLTANDGVTTPSDDIQVTVNADPTSPPPDPATVAPPLNQTVVTTLGDATEFLYTGPNPIQTGVAPGTINKVRVAVLKGRVLNQAGTPLSMVKITVLDHPEFGQTMSRADGKFDLAVNGGGRLHLKYEKLGYLPAQREEQIPWQDYVMLDDLRLLGHDANVTRIDLNATTPIQVARGGVISDSDGTRRATLLFRQGTTATMELPGGAMQGLTLMHIRATEFTIGANGPEAMPAGLPATSGYTYASEFNADEAVAAGARRLSFNQPVLQYLENFLNFPTGEPVPTGSYDPVTGQWMPGATGRTVKVLTITAGTANLDVNGAGLPATDPEYAALGITVAERQTLATLYAVNQSLWRVPLDHFSSWDHNWPFGPPDTARAPSQTGPNAIGPVQCGCPDCTGCKCKPKSGSIIETMMQGLGESIGLTGTPFSLNYRSTRTRGALAANAITIPLTGASLPGPVKRVELEVMIAGQSFRQDFPATLNQSTSFTWNGNDAYGRPVQGQQTATVRIGYVYDGVYRQGGNGFSNYGGAVITGSRTRQEVTLSSYQQIPIGTFSMLGQAQGGWSLSAHHVYDPIGKTLYLGTGGQRKAETVNRIVTTVAGTGAIGFSGDGGPATQAQFNQPHDVKVGADGSHYIMDLLNRRIRKITPDGIINTIAGTGVAGFSGDGGPATQAMISGGEIAVAPDGTVYLSDFGNFRIRRIGANGIITTVVGNGQVGFSGDGGPATQARIGNETTPSIAPDGTLYFADLSNQRVRRVGANGIINTIAGTGLTGFTGDGGLAVLARLDNPTDVEVGPDGAVYIGDTFNQRIRRVGPDGIITTYAGGGNPPVGIGDGGAATAARLSFTGSGLAGTDLGIGPDGTLFISERAPHRIRVVTPDGIINTLLGSGTAGFSGDGGAATAAQFNFPMDSDFGPDGSVYVGDRNNHRVRKVAPPLPGFMGADIAIPSEDGAQLYKFNPQGRHLRTVNTLTGADVYVFTYDSAGRLTQITDGDNNVTTIERNGSGAPTGILSPFNQRTTLQLDANGYLNRITDPANQAYQFTYSANGLMLTETDPRNNAHTYNYDALGRLIKDTNPAGGFQDLARTQQTRGHTVTVTTALGRTDASQLDNLTDGRVRLTDTDTAGLQTILTEQPNGANTTQTPDGSTVTQTLGPDPRWRMQAPLTRSSSFVTPGTLNFSTTFTRTVTLANPNDALSLTAQNDTLSVNGRNFTSNYNGVTRTFTDATPLNRQSVSTIDTQGRVTATQFANFNPGAYSYDARGRLINATFGSGMEARPTMYSYNAAGFLASLTDALNRMTSFSYDLVGRVTQQTLPDSRTIGFTYDANGNLTSLTPPGRPAHTFTYTPIDLVATYTPPTVPGTGATQYAYNLDKQLTTITRPDALTLNFGYDAAGRLNSLTVPNGAYTYSYNATTGNLTGITAPGGGTLAFLYDGSLLTRETWAGTVAGNVSRTFDNNLRVTSQSINGANTINFSYDNDDLLTGAGALTLARHAQNGLITGTTLSNVSDTRSYNGFGEMTGYNAAFNATPLYTTTYTRDKLGRITQKVETIGGGTTTYDYNYDTAGRLLEVKASNVTTSTYTYDSNDNRASLTTPGGTVNGTYDAQDRLTAYGGATYAYTANGELLSKTVGMQTTNYSYDVMGNLRNVTLPGGTQIEYLIDGADRRIGKRVNGVLTQGWLYQNQLKPVAELDGSNAVVSRFVYGSNPDVPDYVIKGGVTYRLITDHLGSVRLVVNVATGAIAQRLDYDEFGVVTLDTNPGFQPFGFAGGLYDAQTKLVRFGARDYDAETGRWTAKDPMRFNSGQANFYVYVLNDPLNLIDPAGLDPRGDIVSQAGQKANELAHKSIEQQILEADLEYTRETAKIRKNYTCGPAREKLLQKVLDKHNERVRFLNGLAALSSLGGLGIAIGEFLGQASPDSITTNVAKDVGGAAQQQIQQAEEKADNFSLLKALRYPAAQ